METAGKLVESENGEKLEEIEGIGTGATRAGIIERIKEHGYIEIKRNTVHVTEKGKLLCEAVKGTLLASPTMTRSEEHTSELQSRGHLVCRLLLEKKKKNHKQYNE